MLEPLIVELIQLGPILTLGSLNPNPLGPLIMQGEYLMFELLTLLVLQPLAKPGSIIMLGPLIVVEPVNSTPLFLTQRGSLLILQVSLMFGLLTLGFLAKLG